MGMETLKMLSNAALDSVKTAQRIIKNDITKDLIAKEGGVWKATSKGKSVGVNIDSDGFMEKEITNRQMAKSLLLNNDGKYSKVRIAGAAASGLMGVSATGRIASGGGLYRDSEGNFDIIGVPFI